MGDETTSHGGKIGEKRANKRPVEETTEAAMCGLHGASAAYKYVTLGVSYLYLYDWILKYFELSLGLKLPHNKEA